MTSRNFCGRLEAARSARGLRQSELAEKAGLEPSAISHFETGRRRPSFDNLERLVDALGVTADYLLGRNDEMGLAWSRELTRAYSKLSAADQALALDFMRFLARRAKANT